MNVWETHWLPLTRPQLGPQPRQVPWRGTELVTFCLQAGTQSTDAHQSEWWNVLYLVSIKQLHVYFQALQRLGWRTISSYNFQLEKDVVGYVWIRDFWLWILVQCESQIFSEKEYCLRVARHGIESIASEARFSGFKSCLAYLVVGMLWASYLLSLCLSVPF